jgi:septal ring factor EnvC (AmiA/AmiB activator)
MRFLFLFLIVAGAYTTAVGQEQPQVRYTTSYTPPTKAQLEAKRKELQDAINETEEQLEAIKKNKNATISQLKALQYKLAQRQSLISNINDEIGNIDNTIVSSSKEIVTLTQKLEMLKTRYAQSIRYAYASRSSYDMLAFVFSSANFNDAVRRMKYLKKFRDFRKQQVDQILETQGKIKNKIGELNKEKQEKDNLLNNQKQQTVALQTDVKETNSAIQEMKGKEEELRKIAEKNRKAAARVNKFINDIIEREMQAALKKAEEEEKRRLALTTKPPVPDKTKETVPPPARTGTVTTTTTAPAKHAPPKNDLPLMLTPTDVALASNFEGNRGKLYWPVAQGYISDRFGVHKISTYIDINNDGIDIRTNAGAAARAVFDGTVSSVFTVEGAQIVIIQHGNYFTVYNNLASVSVTRGQAVKALQTIGSVGENDEGFPTIKFQIWKSNGGKKGQAKLDPEQWIGRVHK